MSPEQAQGQPADARSTIFAFGAWLYEMATGRRAFQGENVITVLAAVINQEPPLAHTIVANAPRELEWIIQRCLKKAPERRIQHMLEVKLALQELLEETESASGAPPGVQAMIKRRRRAWLAPALIALALGLAPGAWLGNRIFRREPSTFQRLTLRNGDVYMGRFAAGGSVAYPAKWDETPPTIFSVQPGNREARDLGLPSANILSVSRSGDMALLLGATGRPERTLAHVP